MSSPTPWNKRSRINQLRTFLRLDLGTVYVVSGPPTEWMLQPMMRSVWLRAAWQILAEGWW